MRFTSLSYLAFLALNFSIYWLVPQKGRKYVALVGSYLFYLSWFPPYLLLLLATTLFNFWLGRRISWDRSEKNPRARRLLSLGVVANLAALVFFKYHVLATESFDRLFHARYVPLRILIPLGISFYTFHCLSYLIDVARGKKAVEDLASFALYVAFWPQLIAGPITRVPQFVPQIAKEKHLADIDLYGALQRLVIGFFFKIVLADTIGTYVDQGFATYKDLYCLDVLFLGLAFGFQVYFDFSAYTSIAIGSAKLIGLELPENFNFPFISRNPTEFWQRWHITLSNWIRDYLYWALANAKRPFSGNLQGYCALLVSMTLCGLWHGANWTFALWGFFHGALLVSHKLIQELRSSVKSSVGPRFYLENFFMLGLLSVSWLIFRAQSFEQLGVLLQKLVTLHGGPTAHRLMPTFFLNMLLLVVVHHLIYLLQRFLEKRRPRGVPARNSGYLRYGQALVLILMAWVTLGFFGNARAFIYFAF